MNKEQLITTYRYVLQRYAIDRFEDAAIPEILNIYRNAKNGVLRDLKRVAVGAQSRVRLTALLREMDSMIAQLTAKVSVPLTNAVGEAGVYSYTNTAQILSWDGKVTNFANVAMSTTQINAMVTSQKLNGKNMDDWIWSTFREEQKALKAEILASKVRGVGYKRTIAELLSRTDNLLSDKKVRENIETVVKSYIQSVNAKAHRDLYEANKNILGNSSGDKVEWSAIMENGNAATGRGTCPRCMALDGQRYKAVERGPSCPLHPRCRCMYMPIVKTWRELGIDMDERNKLDTKYSKWNTRDLATRRLIPDRKLAYGLSEGNYAKFWNRHTKDWQDNAIGADTAKLVRSGRLGFDQIIVRTQADKKRASKYAHMVNDERRKNNYFVLLRGERKDGSGFMGYSLTEQIHPDVLDKMYPRK